MLDDIPALPGTYLLEFESLADISVMVGRRGQLHLQPGFYIYIGSAFGPGGLRARVRHHASISPRPHWHLDYIRPQLELLDVWFSTMNKRLEHAWADAMVYTMHMNIPMQGLGASDCKCESHFFYVRTRPDEQALQTALAMGHQNIALEKIKIQ